VLDMSTTSLRSLVQKEFPDVPEMVNIIECESGFRQFDSEGKPLASKTGDYGIAQINEVHLKQAEKLGLDVLHSVEDNLKMARILYEIQGLNAWVCHKKFK